MDFNLTEEQLQIREEMRKVCREFPDSYWREVDRFKETTGLLLSAREASP